MLRPVLPPRLARTLASAPAATACRQCRRRGPAFFSSSSPRRFLAASAARRAPPPHSSSPSPSAPTLAAYAPAAARQPAPLTEAAYHALADDYLERLLVHLEDMQDAREDVDVEYASGVLTLSFAPAPDAAGRARTYVINKQPPNKQIWLSSPVSGPKRFDWVLDDPSGNDDAATAAPGQWIYLKDGTALNELLRAEIGLDLDAAAEDDA